MTLMSELYHKGTSRTHAWGTELPGWRPAMDPRPSGNSSFVSVDEHTKFTTAALT